MVSVIYTRLVLQYFSLSGTIAYVTLPRCNDIRNQICGTTQAGSTGIRLDRRDGLVLAWVSQVLRNSKLIHSFWQCVCGRGSWVSLYRSLESRWNELHFTLMLSHGCSSIPECGKRQRRRITFHRVHKVNDFQNPTSFQYCSTAQ